MKQLHPGLAEHLTGDTTSVCHAWRVTRQDGVVLGFTEHDRDLHFEDTDFRAASGFQASDTEATSGLSVDASEIAGGFSSAAISEADVLAGRYDGARVEVFLVNWQAVDEHMLLRVQEIGEVTQAGGAFRAELRRLTHRLDQVKGRIYSRRCDAVLGDARCKMNIDVAPWQAEGMVTALLGATRLIVGGLAGAASGFYRYGTIRFLDGAAAGQSVDIENHGKDGGAVTLSLWLPPAVQVAVGDPFEIRVGCDKSFATCRNKFGNPLNFQGFPHLPGADFAFGYADGDSVHDGRPLYG